MLAGKVPEFATIIIQGHGKTMKQRQIEAITAQLQSNHPFEVVDRFILVTNKNQQVCDIKYFSSKENVIDYNDSTLPAQVSTFAGAARNSLMGRPISLAKERMAWMVEDFYSIGSNID